MLRSGKSVRNDDGWLQKDISWLSSRAAITGEAFLRFPTLLIGGRGPLLDECTRMVSLLVVVIIPSSVTAPSFLLWILLSVHTWWSVIFMSWFT